MSRLEFEAFLALLFTERALEKENWLKQPHYDVCFLIHVHVTAHICVGLFVAMYKDGSSGSDSDSFLMSASLLAITSLRL